MNIERVLAHYETDADLTETVLAAIRKKKGSLHGVTVEDLVPMEGFHIRGRKATVELAGLLDIAPSHRVLDLGSGPGGTARYLAANWGCRVTGIDLSHSYARLSAALSKITGLAEKTSFVCGTALRLPFQAARFDMAWSDHVQMNIPEKARSIREIRRVLKPCGEIAFHEVFAGPRGEPFLPAPWSAEAATSWIIPEADFEEMLTENGFRIRQWEDVTEISDRWFQKMQARKNTDAPGPIGIHLVMGPDAEEKIANMGRSLASGRARVIMGVAQKKPDP
jgi:ubiquinone/menaquinone biosynthesis C-methylase UbiE